jgi:hypothetical protein
MLSVIMLNVIMLSGIMLSGIMLSGIMLSGIMLNVIMLNVVAPLSFAAVETFFRFVKTRWLSRLKVHLHWRSLLPKTHATATAVVSLDDATQIVFVSFCCRV